MKKKQKTMLTILRESRGLNQIQLAKQLNIPQSNLSRFEVGYSQIPLEVVKKLIVVLNLTKDELWDFLTDKMPEPQSTKSRVQFNAGSRCELLVEKTANNQIQITLTKKDEPEQLNN